MPPNQPKHPSRPPPHQRPGRRRRERQHYPAELLLACAAVAALWVALVMCPLLAAHLDAWKARHGSTERAAQQGNGDGLAAAVGQTSTAGPQGAEAAAVMEMGHSASSPPRQLAAAAAATEQLVEQLLEASAGPPPPEPATAAAAPPTEQREREADRLVGDMQAHVALHGPAGSFWPAGCRWQQAARPPPSTGACDPASVPQVGRVFGGFEAVWGCHSYEYAADPLAGAGWAAEQPAACRLQPVPLAAWAADRAGLRLGNCSVGWASQVHMATWALEAWREQQKAPAEGEAPGSSSSSDATGASGTQAGGHSGSRHKEGSSRNSAGAAAPLAGLASREVRSEVRCARHYCIFLNLYYQGGRFYLLSDPAGPIQLNQAWQLGRNRVGDVLNVASAASFAAAVNASVVPGETAVLDYAFWIHGQALGHWLEMLLPLFSILRNEPLVRRTPDRLLLLYQQRANLNDWIRGLMAAVLGVRPGQALPPLLFQREAANPLQQPLQLLEGVGEGQWVMFEQVLWTRDVLQGGDRGTADTHDARLLRRLIYTMHGVPHPAPGAAAKAAASTVAPAGSSTAAPAAAAAAAGTAALAARRPAVITLQRKSANRRILNEGEVVAMLSEFGEVRVVEFGSRSTFREQLEAMAATQVFVSVHTSNLVNALLLPPGAAVFEVLQRNWKWADIDRFFYSLTAQLGDVHHYAWRAQKPNETAFLNPALGRLFGRWPVQHCYCTNCVEALTQVDVAVDVAALRQLVAGRLALIRGGASVAEAALPWPGIQPDPPQPAPSAAAGPAAAPGRYLGTLPPGQLARQLFAPGPGQGRPRESAEEVWASVRAQRAQKP